MKNLFEWLSAHLLQNPVFLKLTLKKELDFLLLDSILSLQRHLNVILEESL